MINYHRHELYKDLFWTDEDGKITTAAYVKEFGFSFEEKENWDELLEKNKINFFDDEDVDRAKDLYIKKYGPPKYKNYPFSTDRKGF